MADQTNKPYVKDFDGWHPIKKVIDAKDLDVVPYFSEREIWFCQMGCNVGYEQDGKNEDFVRPVVIVKKYNAHLFMGMPLTTKIKAFPFYFNVGVVDGEVAMAILSQMRPFSSKRLLDKVGTMNEQMFEAMKKATSGYIFGG